jgi:hypothetical protein
MIWTNDGNYVQLADYEKLRDLLRDYADRMAMWADDARGTVVAVEESAQELFSALEES